QQRCLTVADLVREPVQRPPRWVVSPVEHFERQIVNSSIPSVMGERHPPLLGVRKLGKNPFRGRVGDHPSGNPDTIDRPDRPLVAPRDSWTGGRMKTTLVVASDRRVTFANHNKIRVGPPPPSRLGISVRAVAVPQTVGKVEVE